MAFGISGFEIRVLGPAVTCPPNTTPALLARARSHSLEQAATSQPADVPDAVEGSKLGKTSSPLSYMIALCAPLTTTVATASLVVLTHLRANTYAVSYLGALRAARLVFPSSLMPLVYGTQCKALLFDVDDCACEGACHSSVSSDGYGKEFALCSSYVLEQGPSMKDCILSVAE